ncbi:hypothetical protein FRACA_2850010 [Frankia canadensis]|uniref:Uncharacterized protein n=1 Tax=Frankia canadensis TaxID=1836972 RepID=A0A2I2KT62_9ACTN|nr:hypothetical protein FRACA_2850010 [Frankia canadensis]SOU56153.1 hypothetical protein FRACA_2850010 [Frankia canadensis]
MAGTVRAQPTLTSRHRRIHAGIVRWLACVT